MRRLNKIFLTSKTNIFVVIINFGVISGYGAEFYEVRVFPQAKTAFSCFWFVKGDNAIPGVPESVGQAKDRHIWCYIKQSTLNKVP